MGTKILKFNITYYSIRWKMFGVNCIYDVQLGFLGWDLKLVKLIRVTNMYNNNLISSVYNVVYEPWVRTQPMLPDTVLHKWMCNTSSLLNNYISISPSNLSDSRLFIKLHYHIIIMYVMAWCSLIGVEN